MTDTAASEVPIPDAVGQLDDDWLSAALAAATGGGRVVGHERSPIGTGQVADTYRFRLRWDPSGGAGPDTVVVKVTADDPTSREAARATRTYEIEASFYNELAASLPVRAPRCYHAAHDPAGDGYVVVLEDLAPATQGDQLAGCSPEQAALAVDELPRLHAPRWADPHLAGLAWLNRGTPESAELMVALLNAVLPGFVDRYGEALGPDIVALVQRFIPRLGDYLADRPGPWTVAHGDYRLDNLLFTAGSVAVVDWQTVAYGPGVADLAYFVGSAMEPELRRTHERALVERYAAGMAALGVTLEPGWLWTEYRRHSFSGLIMAVVASMLVGRTERGDQMFIAMARRHGHQILDLAAEELLSAP